nr:MAG TPA: hypothetical protein [Caudoviricetes sp.]
MISCVGIYTVSERLYVGVFDKTSLTNIMLKFL